MRKSAEKVMNDADGICTVYGLYSHGECRIRYVGQTRGELNKRLRQHVTAANDCGDSPVHRWIRKVEKSGIAIQIAALEGKARFNLAEMTWIAFFRSVYPDLLNILHGGSCGHLGLLFSDRTRQKMSKPKSLETRLKMSGPKTAETKAKMTLAQIGNTKAQGINNRNASLSDADVVEIRRLLKDGQSGAAIARTYGLEKAAISKIKCARTWRHVPA